MRVVKKYELGLGVTEQKMHAGAKILLSAIVNGVPTLWCEVDDAATLQDHRYLVAPTTVEIPRGALWKSSCIDSERKAWHIFKVTE